MENVPHPRRQIGVAWQFATGTDWSCLFTASSCMLPSGTNTNGERTGGSDASMKNMAQTILLSCESISKTYGMKPLFVDLSFALFDGDHVGLVGPNGSGKSTL